MFMCLNNSNNENRWEISAKKSKLDKRTTQKLHNCVNNILNEKSQDKLNNKFKVPKERVSIFKERSEKLFNLNTRQK